MPPKKLPPKGSASQKRPAAPQETPRPKPATKPATRPATKPAKSPTEKNAASRPSQGPRPTQQAQIPEQDIKQSSSVSAGYALEAGKKAYELRQAAAAAGDPDAREEILGKAINKEIEAESFGKAAKYTRSGTFQGLAAGAGVGVMPGATIGKLTGAIVGGLLSTVGGLLGGGIGSAYGAISGPMWDLGAMASHGVRNVVGDFIGDWPDTGTSTKHQKNTLEKMVLGAQNTKKPSQDELEEMHADDGGASQESYQQFFSDMTTYLPNLDSMPDFGSVSQKMPSMPDMQSVSQGISGLTSAAGQGGQTGADRGQSAGTAAASSSGGTPSQKQASGQASQRQGKPPKLQQRPQTSTPTTSKTAPAAAPTSVSQSNRARKAPKLAKKAGSDNPAPTKPAGASSTPSSSSTQQSAPTKRAPPPKLEPRRQPAAASA